MNCPTCAAGLAQFGMSIRHNRVWCPTCGTTAFIDSADNRLTDICVPKLVERCCEFEKSITDLLKGRGDLVTELWNRLGIRKSINQPEDRT